jgi:hypothetical protein
MGEGRGEGSLRRGHTARAFPRRPLRDETRFTWEVEEMLWRGERPRYAPEEVQLVGNVH